MNPAAALHRVRRTNEACYPAGVRDTSSRRHARWVRVLACLFVSAILADLAFDGACDRAFAATASNTLIDAPSVGNGDPCAGGCVPDCFCCSQAVTHGPAVLPPAAGPVVVAPDLDPTACPSGLLPVPYRPPLNLA